MLMSTILRRYDAAAAAALLYAICCCHDYDAAAMPFTPLPLRHTPCRYIRRCCRCCYDMIRYARARYVMIRQRHAVALRDFHAAARYARCLLMIATPEYAVACHYASWRFHMIFAPLISRCRHADALLALFRRLRCRLHYAMPPLPRFDAMLLFRFDCTPDTPRLRRCYVIDSSSAYSAGTSYASAAA